MLRPFTHVIFSPRNTPLPRKRVHDPYQGKKLTVVYGGEHIETTKAVEWLHKNPSFVIRGVIHEDGCWTLTDTKEYLWLVCQALKLCPMCMQSIAQTPLDLTQQ